MKSTPSKSHHILAGLANYYTITAITMGIFALLGGIMRNPLLHQTILLIYLIIVAVSLVIYHIFSKKTKWLSPGEKIMGRVYRKGEKNWVNPYSKNRFFMFLVFIIGFLMLSEDINTLFFTNLTALTIIVKLIKIYIVFYLMIKIGQGKIKKSLAAFGFYLILTSVSGLALFARPNAPITQYWLISNGIISLLYLAIYFIYRKK